MFAFALSFPVCQLVSVHSVLPSTPDSLGLQCRARPYVDSFGVPSCNDGGICISGRCTAWSGSAGGWGGPSGTLNSRLLLSASSGVVGLCCRPKYLTGHGSGPPSSHRSAFGPRYLTGVRLPAASCNSDPEPSRQWLETLFRNPAGNGLRSVLAFSCL